MKYELVLQGGKNLIIEESDRQALITAEKNNISTVELQGNRFQRSMIKGIFVHKEEVRDNKEAWMQSNREWHEECLKLSKRHIDEKVDSELVVRIFPGLKLNNIQLSDATIAVMQANIKAYFEVFPNAPRCPMKIWWPFIAEEISPIDKKTKRRPNPNIFMGKWWEIVARNDGAIAEWMRYQ